MHRVALTSYDIDVDIMYYHYVLLESIPGKGGMILLDGDHYDVEKVLHFDLLEGLSFLDVGIHIDVGSPTKWIKDHWIKNTD